MRFFRFSFPRIFHLLLILVLSAQWSLSAPAQAWNISSPGSFLVPLPMSAPLGFQDTGLAGLDLNSSDPLLIDFVFQPNHQGDSDDSDYVRRQADYFLTALALPSEDLWVNLSPDGGNRIIPDSFGQSLMGQILLDQDLILKQRAAALMDPTTPSGEKFWNAFHSTHETEGISDAAVATLNRVWVVPGNIELRQDKGAVKIESMRLTVLMESQRQAVLQMANDQSSAAVSEINPAENAYRSLILPLIEEEVNFAPIFAPLREIVRATALAYWYKSVQNRSPLNEFYADHRKMAGLEPSATGHALNTFELYQKNLDQGVFNVIQDDYDPAMGEIHTKQYFSGGMVPVAVPDQAMLMREGVIDFSGLPRASIRLEPVIARSISSDDVDGAMLVTDPKQARDILTGKVDAPGGAYVMLRRPDEALEKIDLPTIPSGLTLTEKVTQITFLLDADKTLTPSGSDVIAPENLKAIVEAVKLQLRRADLSIRFVIISGSNFGAFVRSDYGPPVGQWDLEMLQKNAAPGLIRQVYPQILAELGSETHAVPFIRESLKRRVADPILKGLRDAGFTDDEFNQAARLFEFFTGGAEAASFDPGRQDFVMRHLPVKEFNTEQVVILTRAMALEFLQKLNQQSSHDYSPFIEELKRAEEFTGPGGIHDIILRAREVEDLDMYFVPNHNGLVLVYEANVDGHEIVRKIHNNIIRNNSLFDNLRDDIEVIGGSHYICFAMGDKAKTLLAHAQEQGFDTDHLYIAMDDSGNGSHLWGLAPSGYHRLIPLYLGRSSEVAEHTGVITAREADGSENVFHRGSARIINAIVEIMDRGGTVGEIPFLNLRASPNEILQYLDQFSLSEQITRGLNPDFETLDPLRAIEQELKEIQTISSILWGDAAQGGKGLFDELFVLQEQRTLAFSQGDTLTETEIQQTQNMIRQIQILRDSLPVTIDLEQDDAFYSEHLRGLKNALVPSRRKAPKSIESIPELDQIREHAALERLRLLFRLQIGLRALEESIDSDRMQADTVSRQKAIFTLQGVMNSVGRPGQDGQIQIRLNDWRNGILQGLSSRVKMARDAIVAVEGKDIEEAWLKFHSLDESLRGFDSEHHWPGVTRARERVRLILNQLRNEDQAPDWKMIRQFARLAEKDLVFFDHVPITVRRGDEDPKTFYVPQGSSVGAMLKTHFANPSDLMITANGQPLNRVEAWGTPVDPDVNYTLEPAVARPTMAAQHRRAFVEKLQRAFSGHVDRGWWLAEKARDEIVTALIQYSVDLRLFHESGDIPGLREELRKSEVTTAIEGAAGLLTRRFYRNVHRRKNPERVWPNHVEPKAQLLREHYLPRSVQEHTNFLKVAPTESLPQMTLESLDRIDLGVRSVHLTETRLRAELKAFGIGLKPEGYLTMTVALPRNGQISGEMIVNNFYVQTYTVKQISEILRDTGWELVVLERVANAQGVYPGLAAVMARPARLAGHIFPVVNPAFDKAMLGISSNVTVDDSVLREWIEHQKNLARGMNTELRKLIEEGYVVRAVRDRADRLLIKPVTPDGMERIHSKIFDVLTRVRDVRQNANRIKDATDPRLLREVIKEYAPLNGLSDTDKDQLIEIVRGVDKYIITAPGLSLIPGGPFGHARRGTFAEDGDLHASGIWHTDALLTHEEITSSEIALFYLLMAWRILHPDWAHDFSNEHDAIQSAKRQNGQVIVDSDDLRKKLIALSSRQATQESPVFAVTTFDGNSGEHKAEGQTFGFKREQFSDKEIQYRKDFQDRLMATDRLDDEEARKLATALLRVRPASFDLLMHFDDSEFNLPIAKIHRLEALSPEDINRLVEIFIQRKAKFAQLSYSYWPGQPVFSPEEVTHLTFTRLAPVEWIESLREDDVPKEIILHLVDLWPDVGSEWNQHKPWIKKLVADGIPRVWASYMVLSGAPEQVHQLWQNDLKPIRDQLIQAGLPPLWATFITLIYQDPLGEFRDHFQPDIEKFQAAPYRLSFPAATYYAIMNRHLFLDSKRLREDLLPLRAFPESRQMADTAAQSVARSQERMDQGFARLQEDPDFEKEITSFLSRAYGANGHIWEHIKGLKAILAEKNPELSSTEITRLLTIFLHPEILPDLIQDTNREHQPPAHVRQVIRKLFFKDASYGYTTSYQGNIFPSKFERNVGIVLQELQLIKDIRFGENWQVPMGSIIVDYGPVRVINSEVDYYFEPHSERGQRQWISGQDIQAALGDLRIKWKNLFTIQDHGKEKRFYPHENFYTLFRNLPGSPNEKRALRNFYRTYFGQPIKEYQDNRRAEIAKEYKRTGRGNRRFEVFAFENIDDLRGLLNKIGISMTNERWGQIKDKFRQADAENDARIYEAMLMFSTGQVVNMETVIKDPDHVQFAQSTQVPDAATRSADQDLGGIDLTPAFFNFSDTGSGEPWWGDEGMFGPWISPQDFLGLRPVVLDVR